jgi:DNA-binding IclR family transcriptional regulator
VQEEIVDKEDKVACVNPDGKPTESGTKMLRAIKSGPGSPEEIAGNTGLPLFRVRSGLRELAQVGFTAEKDGKYELTEKGAELVG